MFNQSIYHTIQRYRTLQTHKIHALPIVILMPHSACNCKCVMCDIWKGNKHLKQLTEEDIQSLLSSLRKLFQTGAERVFASQVIAVPQVPNTVRSGLMIRFSMY